MHHLHRFGVPALMVAVVLVVFPMLDLAQLVWPVQFGDIKWRVLSMGSLAQVSGLPLLGVIIAYGAALLLEKPQLLRFMAISSGVAFVLLALAVAFYAVDAIQMRAQVRDATVKDYDLGIVTSFVRFGFALALLAFLSFTERSAGKEMKGELSNISPSPVPLVFRQPEQNTDHLED